MSDATVAWLIHYQSRLALHTLRASEAGHPLLLLHGLGERSPGALPAPFEAWPGSVYGLDFTGHGRSDLAPGGGYTAEILMGDADVAVAHLGSVTVCGRGLGAYVALMLAGGRARSVRGAILCDGPGLAGGGPQPSSPRIIHPDPAAVGTPDAFALAELSSDVRPPDYAMSYVRQAMHLGPLERPITVCAKHRPEWLEAVVATTDTEEASLTEALDYYASARPTEESDAFGRHA
jgi:pimeloyl-ACP methyl ester carboxylesterase